MNLNQANGRKGGAVHRSLALLLTAVMFLAAAGLAAGIGVKAAPTDPPHQRSMDTARVGQPDAVAAGNVSAVSGHESVREGVQRMTGAAAAMSTGACCRGVQVDCPADLNGSGVIDGADLLILLSNWGQCSDPNNCPGDLNDDNVVDGADLLQLLSAWGPCPEGGTCDQVTIEQCESLEGFFLGEGTSCDACPQPIDCPGGAVIENESCGDAINNGCALDPPGYGQLLSCGSTVCGTAWAVGGNRDDDWYRISVAQDTTVTWTVEAPFAVEVRILTQSACPPLLVASSSGMNPTVQACLPSGDFVLAVRPAGSSGIACGSELNGYVGTVSCESCSAPTGACCTPDGGCENVAAVTCFGNEKAQYMGDGSVCGEVQCPFGPPLGLCEDNCGKLFIDDTIGGFCHCDDNFCIANPDQCCPGHCDDCPDLPQCDPTFICGFASGDCCSPNSTPGCSNEACCEAVCSCDAFCCDDEMNWDIFCAEVGPCSAAELCPECGGSPCPTVTCTNNEGEPCGQAHNDGCSASPSNPPFGNVSCGDTICGNLWAAPTPGEPDGARDEDWFKLDLTGASGPVEVTWSVEGSFPIVLFVLTPTCPAEVIEGPISGCTGSISLCLDPGEYILYVAPTAFDGLPCPGFTYQATVTCNAESCPQNQCKGNCGGGFGPPGCYDTSTCECYCDDQCAFFDDCCPGICDDCPSCFGCPGGDGCG